VGLLALCVAGSGWGQVPDSAARWAGAMAAWAKARLAADAGRLWGVRLDSVPWLFIAGPRAFATTDPGQQGYTGDEAGLWSGPLPAGIAPANTAVTWAGRRWAMVLLPLPADTLSAGRLLIHEVWHVVQPQALPLPAYNETGSGADLLDRPEGRVWLRLEWLALARALESQGSARRAALRDALLFRVRRYVAADSAERTRERLLDLAEGMAEYTGWRLSGSDPRALARALRAEAPQRQTYVRSFPYFTGPAYGLLLDVEGPHGWIDSLRRVQDLQALAARTVGIAPVEDAERAGLAYGLDAIQGAEGVRWRERQRQIADLRGRFVDGPTLRLRPGALRISFDFRGQVPLGEAGTVMPALVWRGTGGAALDAPAGALVTADWSELRVPLDTVTVRDGILPAVMRWVGAGWTVTLPAGWRLARTGASWVATPPP
jgi:hypothetical protein